MNWSAADSAEVVAAYLAHPTQSLPATGLDVPAPLFGGTLAILAGIALVRLELRGRRS